MTFLAIELAKITTADGQILTKNLDFWGHLKPLELKINPEVGLLRQKSS